METLMSIHRATDPPTSIPGPCFICGRLLGSQASDEFIFWHGFPGGQSPFIRLHPACARALAGGLSDDLRRLENPQDDE